MKETILLRKMNSTEFDSEEVQLRTVEKAIIVTLWLFIEVLGSVLLIGLIEFERLGGDPLKRRIVDQVRSIILSFNFRI